MVWCVCCLIGLVGGSRLNCLSGVVVVVVSVDI